MHDYRYAEYRLQDGGFATIDMHSVVMVVENKVYLKYGFWVLLTHGDATDLSVALLNMNKNLEENK